MEKEERLRYKTHPIFTFDEMANQKLDRWESMILNNRNSPSIIYSLVIDMFRFIGDKRPAEEILNECTNVKDWYMKHTWTEKQHDEWRNTHLIPVLRKRMHLHKSSAERESSWFMLQWSFTIETN